MPRKRLVVRLAVATLLVVNISSSGLRLYSANEYSATKCGSSSDSLGVDLSSLRPAWSPRDVPDYVSAESTSAPYFNAARNNPAVICGDERRFLLIREVGAHSSYSRTLVLEPDKKYEVYIFFKNDAAQVTRETESRGTRVRLKTPDVVDNPVAFQAEISSDNAVVPSTFSSAVVEPRIGSKWPYIKLESAVLQDSRGQKIADLATDSLKSSQGVLIGCSEADGQVPAGCSGSILVSFSTKKSSYDARISGGYADPDGPWNNAIRIGSTEGFWIRYRYQNVGEVPQDGVKVRLSVASGFPFAQDMGLNAYISGSNRSRTSVGFDELWSDINLERLDVNETAEIHIPFAVGGDWLKKICSYSSKSAWISAATTVPGYFASTTNFFLYPADDMCSEG